MNQRAVSPLLLLVTFLTLLSASFASAQLSLQFGVDSTFDETVSTQLQPIFSPSFTQYQVALPAAKLTAYKFVGAACSTASQQQGTLQQGEFSLLECTLNGVTYQVEVVRPFLTSGLQFSLNSNSVANQFSVNSNLPSFSNEFGGVPEGLLESQLTLLPAFDAAVVGSADEPYVVSFSGRASLPHVIRSVKLNALFKASQHRVTVTVQSLDARKQPAAPKVLMFDDVTSLDVDIELGFGDNTVILQTDDNTYFFRVVREEQNLKTVQFKGVFALNVHDSEAEQIVEVPIEENKYTYDVQVPFSWIGASLAAFYTSDNIYDSFVHFAAGKRMASLNVETPNSVRVQIHPIGVPAADFTLFVDPEWTVADLKARVQDEAGFPIAEQTVRFGSSLLADNLVLNTLPLAVDAIFSVTVEQRVRMISPSTPTSVLPTPAYWLQRPVLENPHEPASMFQTDVDGNNQYTLLNPLDGIYRFRLVVNPPDVSYITIRNALTKESLNEVERPNPYTLIPTFKPGHYVYTALVNDRTTEVLAEVEYSTPNSIQVSGASLPPVALEIAPGGNVRALPSTQDIRITSAIDGTYTITVLRESDLFSVLFNAKSIKTGKWAALPRSLLRFRPGQMEYDVTLDYQFEELSFLARFLTPESCNYDEGVNTPGHVLPSADIHPDARMRDGEEGDEHGDFAPGARKAVVHPFGLLHAGKQVVLRIQSEIDGIYTFRFTRALPRLTNVKLLGFPVGALDDLSAISLPLGFDVERKAYSLNLPYRFAYIQVVATFTDGTQVTGSVTYPQTGNTVSVTGLQTGRSNTISVARSYVVADPVNARRTVISLDSSSDNAYTIELESRLPSVTHVQITSFPSNTVLANYQPGGSLVFTPIPIADSSVKISQLNAAPDDTLTWTADRAVVSSDNVMPVINTPTGLGFPLLTLHSSLDGDIKLLLTRQNDIQSIVLRTCSYEFFTEQTGACSSPVTVVFKQGVLNLGTVLEYDAALPFSAYAVGVFVTTTSNNAANLVLSGITQGPVVANKFYALPNDRSQYRALLQDKLEGDLTYSIVFTRAQPDITGFKVEVAESVFGTVGAWKTLLDATGSAYDGIKFAASSYKAVASFRNKFIRVRFFFNTADALNDVSITRQSGGTITATTTAVSGQVVEFGQDVLLNRPNVPEKLFISFQSLLDGKYTNTIEIDAISSDVFGMSFPLDVDQSAGSIVFGPQNGALVTGVPNAFEPMTYSLSLAADVKQVHFTLRSRSADSGITAELMAGGNTKIMVPLSPVQTVAPDEYVTFHSAEFSVPVGFSYMTLSSPLDGDYDITIFRAGDLQDVQFTLSAAERYTTDRPDMPIEVEVGTPVVFDTPFKIGGASSYTATVPFRWSEVKVKASFVRAVVNAADANTVRVLSAGGSELVAPGRESSSLALKVGINTFTVSSLQDGSEYKFTIVRELPNLKSIVFANSADPLQSTVSANAKGESLFQYFAAPTPKRPVHLLDETNVVATGLPYSMGSLTLKVDAAVFTDSRVRVIVLGGSSSTEYIVADKDFSLNIDLHARTTTIVKIVDQAAAPDANGLVDGDGVYTFTWVRVAPVIEKGVVVVTSSLTGQVLSGVDPMDNIPFAPKHFSFTAAELSSPSLTVSVEHVYDSINIDVIVKPGANVVEVKCNDELASQQGSCPLRIGPNVIAMTSIEDGVMVVVVIRQADLAHISYFAEPATLPLGQSFVDSCNPCPVSKRSLFLTRSGPEGFASSLGFKPVETVAPADANGFVPVAGRDATAISASWVTYVPYAVRSLTLETLGNSYPVTLDSISHQVDVDNLYYAPSGDLSSVFGVPKFETRMESLAPNVESQSYPLEVGVTTTIRVRTQADNHATYLTSFQRLRQSVQSIKIESAADGKSVDALNFSPLSSAPGPNKFSFPAYTVAYGTFAVNVTVQFNTQAGDIVTVRVPGSNDDLPIKSGEPFTVYLPESGFTAGTETPSATKSNFIYITSRFDNVGPAADGSLADNSFYKLEIKRAGPSLGAVQLLPFNAHDGGVMVGDADAVVALGANTYLQPEVKRSSEPSVDVVPDSNQLPSSFVFPGADFALGLWSQEANFFYYRLASHFNAVAVSAHTASAGSVSVSVNGEKAVTFTADGTFSGFVSGGVQPVKAAKPSFASVDVKYVAVELNAGLNKIVVNDPVDGDYVLFVYKAPVVSFIQLEPTSPLADTVYTYGDIQRRLNLDKFDRAIALDKQIDLTQTFTLTLPYAINSVQLQLTQTDADVVTMISFNNGASRRFDQQVFDLPVGTSTLLVQNAHDGALKFQVVRLQPDVRMVKFLAESDAFNTQIDLAPRINPPYMVGGTQFDYHVRVPFAYDLLQLEIDVNQYTAVLYSSTLTQFNGRYVFSGDKMMCQLPVGDQHFLNLFSESDGPLRIIIERQKPDLQRMEMKAVVTQVDNVLHTPEDQFGPTAIEIDYLPVIVGGHFDSYNSIPEEVLCQARSHKGPIIISPSNTERYYQVPLSKALGVQKISLAFSYNTAGSAAVVINGVRTVLTSGIDTIDVPVPSSGSKSVVVFESALSDELLDGSYTIQFLMQADLAVVELNTGSGPVPLFGFRADEHTYAVTLPFKYSQFNVKASFTTGPLSYSVVGASYSQVSGALINNQATEFFSVNVGEKVTLTLASIVDGIYTIVITRSAPALQNIQLIDSQNVIVPVAFNPSAREYLVNLHATQAPFRLRVTYADGDSVKGVYAFKLTELGGNFQYLVNNVWSTEFNFASNTQPVFTISSEADGSYAVTVQRSQLSINTFVFAAFENAESKTVNPTYKWRICSSTVAPNAASPFSIFPDGTVPANYAFLGLAAAFKGETLVQVNGQAIYLLEPSESSQLDSLVSQAKVALLPLAVGKNIISVSHPNDGVYTFSIYRASRIQSLLMLPVINGGTDKVQTDAAGQALLDTNHNLGLQPGFDSGRFMFEWTVGYSISGFVAMVVGEEQAIKHVRFASSSPLGYEPLSAGLFYGAGAYYPAASPDQYGMSLPVGTTEIEFYFNPDTVSEHGETQKYVISITRLARDVSALKVAWTDIVTQLDTEKVVGLPAEANDLQIDIPNRAYRIKLAAVYATPDTIKITGPTAPFSGMTPFAASGAYVAFDIYDQANEDLSVVVQSQLDGDIAFTFKRAPAALQEVSLELPVNTVGAILKCNGLAANAGCAIAKGVYSIISKSLNIDETNMGPAVFEVSSNVKTATFTAHLLEKEDIEVKLNGVKISGIISNSDYSYELSLRTGINVLTLSLPTDGTYTVHIERPSQISSLQFFANNAFGQFALGGIPKVCSNPQSCTDAEDKCESGMYYLIDSFEVCSSLSSPAELGPLKAWEKCTAGALTCPIQPLEVKPALKEVTDEYAAMTDFATGFVIRVPSSVTTVMVLSTFVKVGASATLYYGATGLRQSADVSGLSTATLTRDVPAGFVSAPGAGSADPAYFALKDDATDTLFHFYIYRAAVDMQLQMAFDNPYAGDACLADSATACTQTKPGVLTLVTPDLLAPWTSALVDTLQLSHKMRNNKGELVEAFCQGPSSVCIVLAPQNTASIVYPNAFRTARLSLRYSSEAYQPVVEYSLSPEIADASQMQWQLATLLQAEQLSASDVVIEGVFGLPTLPLYTDANKLLRVRITSPLDGRFIISIKPQIRTLSSVSFEFSTGSVSISPDQLLLDTPIVVSRPVAALDYVRVKVNCNDFPCALATPNVFSGYKGAVYTNGMTASASLSLTAPLDYNYATSDVASAQVYLHDGNTAFHIHDSIDGEYIFTVETPAPRPAFKINKINTYTAALSPMEPTYGSLIGCNSVDDDCSSGVLSGVAQVAPAKYESSVGFQSCSRGGEYQVYAADGSVIVASEDPVRCPFDKYNLAAPLSPAAAWAELEFEQGANEQVIVQFFNGAAAQPVCYDGVSDQPIVLDLGVGVTCNPASGKMIYSAQASGLTRLTVKVPLTQGSSNVNHFKLLVDGALYTVYVPRANSDLAVSFSPSVNTEVATVLEQFPAIAAKVDLTSDLYFSAPNSYRSYVDGVNEYYFEVKHVVTGLSLSPKFSAGQTLKLSSAFATTNLPSLSSNPFVKANEGDFVIQQEAVVVVSGKQLVVPLADAVSGAEYAQTRIVLQSSTEGEIVVYVNRLSAATTKFDLSDSSNENLVDGSFNSDSIVQKVNPVFSFTPSSLFKLAVTYSADVKFSSVPAPFVILNPFSEATGLSVVRNELVSQTESFKINAGLNLLLVFSPVDGVYFLSLQTPVALKDVILGSKSVFTPDMPSDLFLALTEVLNTQLYPHESSFLPGVHSYKLKLPFGQNTLSLASVVETGSPVTLKYTYVSATGDKLSQGEVVPLPLGLAPTDTELSIPIGSSTLYLEVENADLLANGDKPTYVINVVRQAAALQHVGLYALEGLGSSVTQMLLANVPFNPDVRAYTIDVPQYLHSISSVGVLASFQTEGDEFVQLINPDVMLSNSLLSQPIPLDSSRSVLVVHSTRDGDYTFTINRGADVRSVRFFAVEKEFGSKPQFAAEPIEFDVAFVPGQTGPYTVYLPNKVEAVRVSATYLTPNTFSCNMMNVAENAEPVVIGLDSPSMGQSGFAQTQIMCVSQDLDGAYSFHFNRAAPDVSSLTFNFKDVKGQQLHSLSYSDSHTAAQSDANVLFSADELLYVMPTKVSGDANTVVVANSVKVTIKYGYSVDVPEKASQTLYKVTLNGDQLTAVTASASTIEHEEVSHEFELRGGLNLLQIQNSVDGTYNVVIYSPITAQLSLKPAYATSEGTTASHQAYFLDSSALEAQCPSQSPAFVMGSFTPAQPSTFPCQFIGRLPTNGIDTLSISSFQTEVKKVPFKVAGLNFKLENPLADLHVGLTLNNGESHEFTGVTYPVAQNEFVPLAVGENKFSFKTQIDEQAYSFNLIRAAPALQSLQVFAGQGALFDTLDLAESQKFEASRKFGFAERQITVEAVFGLGQYVDAYVCANADLGDCTSSIRLFSGVKQTFSLPYTNNAGFSVAAPQYASTYVVVVKSADDGIFTLFVNRAPAPVSQFTAFDYSSVFAGSDNDAVANIINQEPAFTSVAAPVSVATPAVGTYGAVDYLPAMPAGLPYPTAGCATYQFSPKPIGASQTESFEFAVTRVKITASVSGSVSAFFKNPTFADYSDVHIVGDKLAVTPVSEGVVDLVLSPLLSGSSNVLTLISGSSELRFVYAKPNEVLKNVQFFDAPAGARLPVTPSAYEAVSDEYGMLGSAQYFHVALPYIAAGGLWIKTSTVSQYASLTKVKLVTGAFNPDSEADLMEGYVTPTNDAVFPTQPFGLAGATPLPLGYSRVLVYNAYDNFLAPYVFIIEAMQNDIAAPGVLILASQGADTLEAVNINTVRSAFDVEPFVFSSSIHEYTITVPNRITTVQLAASYRTPGSVVVVRDGSLLQKHTHLSSVESLPSSSVSSIAQGLPQFPSSPLRLNIGQTVIVLVSAKDGEYRFTITREDDVQDVSFVNAATQAVLPLSSPFISGKPNSVMLDTQQRYVVKVDYKDRLVSLLVNFASSVRADDVNIRFVQSFGSVIESTKVSNAPNGKVKEFQIRLGFDAVDGFKLGFTRIDIDVSSVPFAVAAPEIPVYSFSVVVLAPDVQDIKLSLGSVERLTPLAGFEFVRGTFDYTSTVFRAAKSSFAALEISSVKGLPIVASSEVQNGAVTVRLFGPDDEEITASAFNTPFPGLINFTPAVGLNTLRVYVMSDRRPDSTAPVTPYVIQFVNQPALQDFDIVTYGSGSAEINYFYNEASFHATEFVPGVEGEYSVYVPMGAEALRFTGAVVGDSKAVVRVRALPSPAAGKDCMTVARTEVVCSHEANCARLFFAPEKEGQFDGRDLTATVSSTGLFSFLTAADIAAVENDKVRAALQPSASGVTCYMAQVEAQADFGEVPVTFIVTRLGPTVSDISAESVVDSQTLAFSPAFERGQTQSAASPYTFTHPAGFTTASGVYVLPYLARRMKLAAALQNNPLDSKLELVDSNGNVVLTFTNSEAQSLLLNAPAAADASYTDNAFRLVSPYDGSYYLNFRVAAPVVSAITLTKIAPAIPAFNGQAIVYDFKAGNTEEEIVIGVDEKHAPINIQGTVAQQQKNNLPFGVTHLKIDVAADVELSVNGKPALLGKPVPLVAGANHIEVYSANDGHYFITVFRNEPVISDVSLSVGTGAAAFLLDSSFDAHQPGQTAYAGVPNIDDYNLQVVFSYADAPNTGAADFTWKFNDFTVGQTPVYRDYPYSNIVTADGKITFPELQLLRHTETKGIYDNTIELVSPVDGVYKIVLLGAVVKGIQLAYVDVNGVNVPMTYAPAFVSGIMHGSEDTMYNVQARLAEEIQCVRVAIQYPVINIPGAPVAWLNEQVESKVTLTPSAVSDFSAEICSLNSFDNVLSVEHPIDGVYRFKVYRQPSRNNTVSSIAVAVGMHQAQAELFTIAERDELPGFSLDNAGPYSFALANNQHCITVVYVPFEQDQQVTVVAASGTLGPLIQLKDAFNPSHSKGLNSFAQSVCDLPTGESVVEVVVRAQAFQDVADKRYVLNVVREKSTNAQLSTLVFYAVDTANSLEVPVAFERTFDAASTAPYRVTIPGSFDVGVVVARVADARATLQVSAGGADFKPYSSSLPSELNDGTTGFLLLVTAESGDKALYEVHVTRLPSTQLFYAPGAFKCVCAADATADCAAGSLVRTNQCVDGRSGKIVDYRLCMEKFGSTGEQVQCFPLNTFHEHAFPQYINDGKIEGACNC